MFDEFKNRMAFEGKTMGEVLKKQSDMIMDATFTRDIAYRKCYILDNNYFFPEQTLEGYIKAKAVFAGTDTYNPEKIKGFKPIDAKYLIHTYTSLNSDTVDYYLQFRPLAHGQNPNIRVGNYVFVPDDLGVYRLWIIVARDNRPQFPQFYILQCDSLLKWHIGHEEIPLFEGAHVDTGTYYTWSVQRTQSSYNSGVWSDYSTTTVQNQLKAWLPTNRDTNTIFYNEHFVIGYNDLRRIAWEVSKVETSTTCGITKLTFKQELEYDPVDNLSWINMSSDNYSDSITGIDYDFYCPRTNDKLHHDPVSPEDVSQSIITYTGVKPSLKIGGNYKTFTANIYKNGAFVLNRPYWTIEYFVDDSSIFKLNFIYADNELVCDNASGIFDIIDKNTIVYNKNQEQIFGIKYIYDYEKPMELKLKCLPILNMIGGRMVLSVDDDITEIDTVSASLEVEVESL